MLFTKQKLRGWLVVATFVIVPIGLMVKPASAHTLDLDGDIAVVLHVNPNDNPTSGTRTSFILFFNDDTNRFTLQKCNCRATILQGTQTIVTEQLADTQSLQSNDPVTFSKPGAYTIAVDGRPKVANAFQPFYVSYLVRVTPGVTRAKSIPLVVWIGLGIIMVATLAYAKMFDKRKNGRSKDKYGGD